MSWPTHKFRIWVLGFKVHEGDNLLVALERFGEICGAAPDAAALTYSPGKHDLTGEPVLEAVYGVGGMLFGVLYGITLDQWVEHGKVDK